MAKAAHSSQARVLTDIPSIGKSIAGDLRGLGVKTPADVTAMDPGGDIRRAAQGTKTDP